MLTNSREAQSNEAPAVSVIIPTYNRAHLVGRAIRSVLSQTYQDFEIIVVDDSSNDNTEDVVKHFNDSRIRYIRHENNRGGSAARNTGIKAARGEYVAFLDSDDEWLCGKLEYETSILNSNSDCTICSTGHSFINEKTGVVVHKRQHLKNQVVSQATVLRGECLTTNDFTARREAIISVGGFDERLPARQDWDLWIRITRMSHGIQIPINTVKIYVGGHEQISTGFKNKLAGTILILRKHEELFSSDRIAFTRILSTLGLMSILDNNGQEARSYFKEAFKLTSTKKRKAKLGVLVAVIGLFHNRGVSVVNRYYRWRYPNSYLLW